MERQPPACTEGSVEAGYRNHSGWMLILIGLLCWQAWMTLMLFRPIPPQGMEACEEDPAPALSSAHLAILSSSHLAQQAWSRLRNEEPIISGRHPLHLYHGYLGARSWQEWGSPCCYDPAFQAGYPKTPVFDNGCRPAELFLSLAGGSYSPAAYKIGLAWYCLLVPIALVVAARGVGLGPGSASLSAAAGMLICWGNSCRATLEGGDLNLLLAALAGVIHCGLLVRFDRAPSLATWFGLLAADALGWFTHPLAFALFVPLNLIYYLSVGCRHARLCWHLALMGALAGGVALNGLWLTDWFAYWWIRSPVPPGERILPHRTLLSLWNADLWGDADNRVLTLVLLIGGLLGIGIFNQTKRRPAARLLGLAAGGFLALTIAGVAWEPLGRVGTQRLLAPALWFAVVPAVHALIRVLQRLGGWMRLWPWERGRWAVPLLTGVGLFGALVTNGVQELPEPLHVGLGPQRQELVDNIVAHTTPEARILWEDRLDQPLGWTALLPVLTDRAFLGGLDPHSHIDYTYASLVDQKLAGRSLSDWSDVELDDFCRRYNVGWVVCWSPAAQARFSGWQQAGKAVITATLRDDIEGRLFTLQRPRSYILKGQARLLRADSEHIILADVIPEDGQVILSMHYQTGLHVSPARLRIEREPDANDPIPFIRLRVPGPATRVTLTWRDR